MGELEDQIARLAQHRADQVPPYRAPASLDRARRTRRGVWLAAAAVVTAIAVAAGVLLWDRGDDASVRTGPPPATQLPAPTTPPATAPPTTPPTTAPAVRTCPAEQVDTNPMSGGPASRTEDAVLLNVQIQTSACVDEVAFRFRGTPDWSVEYRPAPIELQPQGEPVDIEGRAFLVVTFHHADAGRAGYDGPKQLRAGPLSHVTEVRETQDFEAVLTWVIGLDAQVPFGVEVRPDEDGANLVVIRFPESGPERAVTCRTPERHLEYSVPSGWYVELSDDFRCSALGPAPFVIVRNSDVGWPVFVGTSPTPTLTDTLASPTVLSSTSNPVVVDGRAGTCAEGEYSGVGLYPRGTRFFACEVPWDGAGYLGVSTVADGEEYRAAVRSVMESARYLP